MVPAKKPRRRLVPSYKPRKPKEVLTPLEAMMETTRELLDQLAYLAVSDPDAEQEFARLVEREFERLGVPPPKLDIFDDIEHVASVATEHLRRYEDIVMPYKPPSDVDEEEALQMMALGVIATAARITLSWYSPPRNLRLDVEWPRAVQSEEGEKK